MVTRRVTIKREALDLVLREAFFNSFMYLTFLQPLFFCLNV